MTHNDDTGLNSVPTTERTVSLREYAELQREYEDYREENELDKARIKHRITEIEDRETESSGDDPEGETTQNDMENALPIQQVTKIWKVGGTINANKTEHAAAIWSDFFDRADNGREVLYLPTDKVEQILKEHFRHDDRHLGVTTNIKRATIHRAMDALEDLAGTLVSSNIIKNGRRALMINQQEFRDFCDAIGATTDVTPDTATGVTRGS